jgi:hypothetical protein
MYPTALVGLVLVAAAIQYACQPQGRVGAFRVVRHLSVLTGLVACLAFVSGAIRSFTCASEVDPRELGGIVVTGIGESLHNIGLGLALLVIAWIAVSIGAVRAGARCEAAELTDPNRP